MSRVPIKDLYWEIDQDTYANNVWNGYKDIEIVPRKMVEMIIERCEETIKKQERAIAYSDADSYISGNALAIRLSVMQLKEYAESLLKRFEEEHKKGESVNRL